MHPGISSDCITLSDAGATAGMWVLLGDYYGQRAFTVKREVSVEWSKTEELCFPS
jgi:hypothetical protein